MRRIFLIVLCVCPLWALAANTLSLSSVSGHPSDIVKIEASMSGAEEVVACEWRIPLGQYLSYVPNSAVLNTARSNGHSITATSYNDTLIVSIYSISLKPIVGTDGVLFSFQLTLGSEPATYTLTPEVLLSDENGSSISASIQSGAVTILSPKISVITSQVDFGHIPIRETYTRTLQVQNVGNEDMHITDAIISAEALSLPQSKWTIAAGQTQSITLTYKPIVRGAISETIHFRSDAINDADVFQANKVTIVADPFSVNELHVVGASGISDDTVTISLRVNNMEPLVGVQCSFKLPAALEFVLNSATIADRCSRHSLVSSVRADTVTLMLYSLLNDTIEDYYGEILTFRLKLNGTSGNYALNPIDVMLSNISEENMTSAVYGTYVEIQSPRLSAPTELHFNDAPITEVVTATYTISNYGNAELVVDRIYFLAEGFDVMEQLPLHLSSWQSQTITVAYTPSKEGDFRTVMQVYSNDPTNRMHTVSLSGQIFEPNEMTMTGEQIEDDGYQIHVSLVNYTPIVGAQMDLQSIEGTTPTFVPSTRLTNHSSMMIPLGDNKYRILIFSLSNEAISGSSGTLFEIVYASNDRSAIHNQLVTIDSVYLSDIDNIQRLTASYAEQIIHFTYMITWQNEDGSLIDQTTVEYGVVPTHADPIKAATAEYTYRFAGWTPNVVAVTGDATYRATFNATNNSYTITWLNEDGSLIDQTTVEYGIVPTHVDPIKAATAEYTYTFAGWTPNVVAVTGDATYRATFNATKNSYTITWLNEDGSLIDQTTVEYGVIPTHADPVKANTAGYTYTFAGWTPSVVAVTGDATYRATFSSEINMYTISVNAINGDVEGAGEYAYGTEVELTAIPASGYKFDQWSDGIKDNPRTIIVTGNAEYTAIFIQSQGIGDVYISDPARRVIIDDKIYILRGEKVYTVTGQEVK